MEFFNTTAIPTDILSSKIQECRLRMYLLGPPLTYIFATMFVITALVASLGNTVAIAVLWMPDQRTKSNRILTSLAISDALVGYILIPINAYQLINEGSLENCPLDITRAYFTVLLIGSSAITLGIISYDRYILLTKLNNYNIHMSNKRISFMIGLAWFLPAITPALRLIGKHIYLPMLFLVFVLPLVASCVNYCIITKVIYQQEQLIRKNIVTNSERPIIKPTLSDSKDNNKDNNITDQDNVASDGSRITTTLSKVHSTNAAETKTRKDENRHLKLAKVVAILIACYSFCMIPFIMWMVLDFIDESITDFLSTSTIQNLYIFSIFSSSGNSCLNPCIYIAKNPEFKRGLLKLLRMVRRKTYPIAFTSANPAITIIKDTSMVVGKEEIIRDKKTRNTSNTFY